jgi:hypothetical protein
MNHICSGIMIYIKIKREISSFLETIKNLNNTNNINKASSLIEYYYLRLLKGLFMRLMSFKIKT